MNKSKRKLILYISMSLDGFIADAKDNLDFLSQVEKEGEDYGYHEFTSTVDTVIIGRKSYEKVLSMGFDYPHTEKKVYIITKSKRLDIGSFEFYSGRIQELISMLKKMPGKDIYCDGGAQLANEIFRNKQFDEIIISIIPVLLGKGIRLFDNERPIQQLQVVSIKNFEKGLVQLHYKCIE